MRVMMEENLKTIADHYGLENQLRQLAEECSELAVETLKKADEILINPDGRVESEHEAKDSLKANVSDFYKLLQWFKDKNALTDAQIGLGTGMSATAIRKYRIGERLPRGKRKKAIKDYMNEVGGISEDEFDPIMPIR